MRSVFGNIILGESIGVAIETRPPSRPLSSASLALHLSSYALDSDEAALIPSLHNELPVELVLSERLGGSPMPNIDSAFAERSSCEHSSNGVLGEASTLLIEAFLLRETEGVRDRNQDVSDPLLLIRIGEGGRSE
jgi:hypothetical protein